jgi:RimJ/RimL family protein N-acetyltransferase
MKAVRMESKRLWYQALSLQHLSDEYVSWMNDKKVYQYLETGGDYTIHKLKAYLEVVENSDVFFWAIHTKSNNKHIGNIKIDPISFRNGLGEYGILIGDRSEWGKGYAKEASLTIIDYCFDILNLRKITLGVIEDNIDAVKMYENLGFTQEGLYIDHGIYNGKYCNAIRMALFNSAHKESN